MFITLDQIKQILTLHKQARHPPDYCFNQLDVSGFFEHVLFENIARLEYLPLLFQICRPQIQKLHTMQAYTNSYDAKSVPQRRCDAKSVSLN